MATNIFNYDGTLLTNVADGALDTTHASIKFPGRGYQNYGQPISENLLWILQNFAGTAAPPYPVTGQLWYDTSSDNSVLKVYTGAEWITAGGVIASDTAPAAGSNQGAFWYDTRNKQLNTWNGANWDLVGPLGSKINQDPVDPALPVNSAVEAMIVQGTDGNDHQLWRISIGGVPLAVISKDQEFEPVSSLLTSNGFPRIYPGINFNNTIPNIGLAGESTLFKSNQNNVPDRDGFWELGSTSNRFRTVYTSSASVSSSLGVNATPSSNFRLQVNGSSYLNGPVTLGAGTASAPPLKFTASTALTQPPQNGSVEFDGNNFYFTGLLNGVPTRRQPVFSFAASDTKTLYVSSLGNDTNDGRSRTTAFKTIKRALQFLIDNNLSGFSIFVESGEYLEQNPLYVPPFTSVVGDNLRRVTVRPVHDQLDLFHVDVNSFFFGMTFKDHRAPAFCFAFPCSLATATVNPINGSISQIVPTYSQTGYSGDFNVFVEAPAYGGTQATAVARIINGAVVDVVVTNGGSGYTSRPNVSITGSTGVGATARARIKGGRLVAIDMLTFGSNYTAPVSVVISGGGGVGAEAQAVLGDGVIGSIELTNAGSGYDPDRAPWVSIKGVTPPFIFSSPYVQNCSSITGPFDVYDPITNTGGDLITLYPPYDLGNPGSGFGPVDPNGAGGGIRIDGEVCSDNTVIRSFVADSFTQLNQGGIGHLIINRGYAQFVSCFTTFSSIGYWARGGGFANISNSVIDFGDVGLKAEGYYPGPSGNGYTTGKVAQDYRSTVSTVDIVFEGSGYTTDFAVTISQGLGPGGTAATGIARVDSGRVTRIDLTSPGSGYTSQPVGTFELVGGTGTGARYSVTLTPIADMLIKDTSYKPQTGSGMLYNNVFYTVRSATDGGEPGSWFVSFTPAIIAADEDDMVQFHEISNLSTGGIVFEYVGSGVTYNALPVYGGIPETDNQVQDRNSDSGIADPAKKLGPGVVYYVTIDNTGDFSIGPYFGVNFVDGTIRLNPASGLELTNIKRIGPFSRNGIQVGWYADEISKDPLLTHPAQPVYDDSTLTTQSAVRGYIQQISTDVLPDVTGLRDLGSVSRRWNNLDAVNGNLTALSSTGGTITNLSSTNGTITNLGSTTATITTLNATNGTFSGSVIVGGNLTVNGNTAIINSTVTVLRDPTLELGAGINDQPLTSNDGLDRGLFMHYYDGAASNHSFLGMQNSTGKLLYLRNVSPGAAQPANPVNLTGTTWGPVEVGATTVNGQLTVNGDIIATGDIVGFFVSPSDQRLKTNLKPIESALSSVRSISGMTFEWNDAARELRPTRNRREMGLMAQEVERIAPEVVATGADGYKTVAYDKLVPLLIEAIKELSDRVDDLQRKLAGE